MRLIDADELLKDGHQHYDLFADEYYILVRDVEDAPTIEERKKGEWIEIKHTFHHKCSRCGWINDADSGYNFCPDCGSDNREEITDG